MRAEPTAGSGAARWVISGNFPEFPSSSSPLLVSKEPRWCGVKTPLSIKFMEYVSFCSLRFSSSSLSPGLREIERTEGTGLSE